MQPTLSEKTYRHIRKQIAVGNFSPGEHLTTRAIAAEVGVSLGPVREAINRLASEGLLSHVPGAGASVRQPSRRDLEELYILRQAIESFAAREAAKYISIEQLEAMKGIVEDGFAIAEKIRGTSTQRATKALAECWFDVEEQFHGILIESSRNHFLSKVIEEHRAIAQVFDLYRKCPELITLKVAEETCCSHQQLVQSLRDRDPELARRLMSEHIEKDQKAILANFRKAFVSHGSRLSERK